MKSPYESPHIFPFDPEALLRSERRLRRMVETMPYAVAIFQDGRVAYANRASADIFALGGVEDMIGRDVMGPVPDHERDRLAAWAAARQADEPGCPDHLSVELRRADGGLLPVDAYASPFEHHGRPALLVVAQDMSKRTDALRASEHRYRSLVEQLPVAVGIIQDMKLIFVNQTTVDMLGYDSVSELLAGDMLSHVVPEEIERLSGYLAKWNKGDPDRPTHYTTLLRRRDGERFPVEIVVQSITFEGRPATQAVAIDLSERAAAEKSLWTSTELYRRLVELSPNAITVTDLEGNILVSNHQAARMHGFDSLEVMQAADLSAFDLIAEHERPRAAANAERVLAGETVRDEPYTLVRADGSTFPAELSASLLINAEGEPEAWIGVTRDVTERNRTAEALRTSEEQYRALVDTLPHGVGIIQDRRIAFVNPAAARLLGYERPDQIIGREADLPLVAGERERVIAMLGKLLRGETEGPIHYTTRAHRKDGSIFPVEVFATRILHAGRPAIQLFMMDISDRVRAEQERLALQAQVQHAQKLESLGVLAGGIAHDFNNLLMAVLGNVGLAQMDLPPESPVRSYLDSVETTAQRAADLTQQMLAYSGKGQFQVGPIRIERLVAEMAHLLRSAISKKADLRTAFDDDLPAVRGDATQLRQVIMNLITNASEALGEDGGSISLSVTTCTTEQSTGTGHQPTEALPAGRYVCIDVTDSGVGMDQETQKKIFDPFFTTKFTGRGLGLAAVQGIVRGHDGLIEVDSQPGEGTTCRVWLPVADPGAQDEPEEHLVTQAAQRYEGTVLLADDEPSVRETTGAMLRHLGLRVVTAADGDQALETLRVDPDLFDLAVIDLTMPRVDGQEFLAEAHTLRPDLACILMSGYSQTQAFKGLAGTARVVFIQKPFTTRQLAAKIGELLGD